MGTRNHSRIQRRLLELLEACSDFEAFPELHTRLRETEFRIPDILVEQKPVTADYYPSKPVHLCVEIISPDQTLGQMLKKCERYHSWGTQYCWVIDPESQIAWEYHKGDEPKRMDREKGILSARAGFSYHLTVSLRYWTVEALQLQ